mmetsp:Transcript_27539/g.40778  ORF Transcript_27539/g.40778 Transcript_27539/m.40778 type:complete len:219 (+) Transcript_27539:988-1644(+)
MFEAEGFIVLSCGDFCLGSFDVNTRRCSLKIFTKGVSSHQLSSQNSGCIFGHGYPPVHFFYRAQPRVSIHRLTNLKTEAAKGFSPFLLHVKLEQCPFLRIRDGVQEFILHLGEIGTFRDLSDETISSLENLGRELRILHLFSKTRLLGFEHRSEEIVQLDALSKRKHTVLEQVNKFITKFDFLQRPASSAAVAGILIVTRIVKTSLAALCLLSIGVIR